MEQSLDHIRSSPSLLNEKPNMEMLMKFTSQFIEVWNMIACYLNFNYANISNIALQESSEKCYISMLEHWLQTDADATWKKYIEILDKLPPLDSKNTTLNEKEKAKRNLGADEVSSKDIQSQSADVEAFMDVNEQTSATSQAESLLYYKNHCKKAFIQPTDSGLSLTEESHHVAEPIPIIYIESMLRGKPIETEMESGDKISQLKDKIILQYQMLQPRIADQLIVELFHYKTHYILEDDDLVDKIKEKKSCMVIIKEIHELKNQDKATAIVEQVGIYFEKRIKDKWKATEHKNKSKIKSISAMIKENTTDFNSHENRFQVISFATGTTCQSCCSNKEKYFDICDGHAASLCYYGAQIYFQTQLKKIIDSVEPSPSLFYSTENGYAVKPYYQFHLFISKPPCGFMRDDQKYLVSWKIPFEKQPHIPECSSRILINSYLGIQGPLTLMFAQPIYIANVIVLKCDELKPKDSKQTNFAVFDDTKAVEAKLEDLRKTLQATYRFHFNKPEILVHAIDKTELNKHFDQTVCSFTLDLTTESQTCSVSIPSETGNKGQYLVTSTKVKDKLRSDKEENKKIQELWKLMQTKILGDRELFPYSQVHRCFQETQEAMKRLCETLKMDIAIEKAKKELENKIKTCEQIMENDFKFLKENFETLCLKECENTQGQEESMIKKFHGIPDKLLEKKDNVIMVKFLDILNGSNIELLDCTWNKYCSMMKIAIQEKEKNEFVKSIDAVDIPDPSSSTMARPYQGRKSKKGFDIPDVSKLTIGVDYHRLLWQELNKNFGNPSASTIFVMAVGQQLSSSDYDITAGHAELAAQKTFELVNQTIPCATNYSSKGSQVSMMWERLRKVKGPRAGPEHRSDFEKAKRELFVDYEKKKPTELYQRYLNKEIALKQKLKNSVEDIEFQHAAIVVQPHLDAIKVWEHGPLVHNLNQIKKALEENTRTVHDYSKNLLRYYHVSLQPENWYQWFDPFQHEDGAWMQIKVDSENDDDDQAALYRKLGGSVTTYHGLDKHSNVKISFKVRAVQINRPWVDLSVLNNKYFKIYGEDPGSWSTGELDADNKGSFPLLSTQMIVAKDITVTASTKMVHQAIIPDVCSLFGVGSNSYATNDNSIELKGTQVIGYVCALLPKFPH